MQLLYFLGALFVTLGVSQAAIGNWHTSKNGNLFYIETEPQFNWFQALDECVRRNMSLYAFDRVEKYAEIYSLVYNDFEDDALLWIGGHDNAIHQRYEWISTGQRFDFNSQWAANQPNDVDGTKRCVATHFTDLAWMVAACSSKLGFVCEENLLLRDTNSQLLATQQKLDELSKSSDFKTIKDTKQVKKFLEIQSFQLRDTQRELEALKESAGNRTTSEQLQSLKQFHEIQATLLRQTQEELKVFKNSDKEETTTKENQTLNEIKEAKLCPSDHLLGQTLAQLEALTTSHERQMLKLNEKTEELQTFRKENQENFTKQLSEGKFTGSQTHQTATKRFYNFVLNINENS